MINEEEISNERLIKRGEIIHNTYSTLNKTKGKIKPINARYTNDSMQNSISDANEMIDDLIYSFAELRKDSDSRRVIRALKNTPGNILDEINKRPEKEHFFKSFLGVNTFENLRRLGTIIKCINNINLRRKTDGIENSGYKDFSKEITKLKVRYDTFMGKRLTSVYTEEINYFNY